MTPADAYPRGAACALWAHSPAGSSDIVTHLLDAELGAAARHRAQPRKEDDHPGFSGDAHLLGIPNGEATVIWLPDAFRCRLVSRTGALLLGASDQARTGEDATAGWVSFVPMTILAA